ncbi:hypothetical protein BN1723_021012 [Verticillium longisporum]|uniref:Uncharacterized protein n=1 Tax=Verticillium longisporum TaxID=100787 RepID=A0A0G4KU99_VERLO|nr:hypothetical protein BN1723_021012 [Verticillium longisporum]
MTIYETYPFGKPSAKNYKCRLGCRPLLQTSHL